MRILASLAIAFCLAGCGDDTSNKDSGSTQDLAMSIDGGGKDLACDNSMPTNSLCGHVCDKGNSKGIGKYCDDKNPCPQGMICTATVRPDTFFCTVLTQCTPDASGKDTATCGEDTVCQCQQGLGCGCTPAACAAPQG